MILRRIYLLFPGRRHADRAVADLTRIGIDQQHIHAIAKPGVDISGLPKATLRQRSDFVARLDHWFWDLNLLIFFFALALCLFAVWSANWGWAAGLLSVMGLTYLLGHHFVRHVPHAHQTECQTALRHGEILLLVDVPHWRLAAVERAIRRQHPEMELGGVTWTLDVLGI